MKYDRYLIKKEAEYCLNCKNMPCMKACPLNNKIPNFIKLIKEDKINEAHEVLLETTILGHICGTICPHEKQCQGSCIRGIKGEPVQIGTLEDYVFSNVETYLDGFGDRLHKSNGKKVAIIGGGPTGLTSAVWLAKFGFDITIYEQQELLGGILRYGIPKFRLNEDILNKFINEIYNMKIKSKCNITLGKDISFDSLKKEYDAVVLSFGANISNSLRIPGEEIEFVLGGNELLEKENHPDYTNKVVGIIGGGNVAMDSARTIKRLGAKKVIILYRRNEENMPASLNEIKEAKNDGIEFIYNVRVTEIFKNPDGSINKIGCIKTKVTQEEKAVDIEDSNYYMNVDYIIRAIGSHVNKKVINLLKLDINEKGYLKVDENYMTSQVGVFAGGDIIGTTSTVAWASRDGREIANSINRYFNLI